MLFFYPNLRKDGDAMPQDEKTKAAFERIEQGVKDVYSSENFKQYLFKGLLFDAKKRYFKRS